MFLTLAYLTFYNSFRDIKKGSPWYQDFNFLGISVILGMSILELSAHTLGLSNDTLVWICLRITLICTNYIARR